MSKSNLYTQCMITSSTSTGKKYFICWIPSKFAKPDHVISLKNKDGEWEGGWVVTEVYNSKTVEEVTKSEFDRGKSPAVGDVKRLSNVK